SSASTRVVFPAPEWPTSTTLRTLLGSSTTGAGPVTPFSWLFCAMGAPPCAPALSSAVPPGDATRLHGRFHGALCHRFTKLIPHLSGWPHNPKLKLRLPGSDATGGRRRWVGTLAGGRRRWVGTLR